MTRPAIDRYEELLAERDLLVRRVAGLEITSEALRALPADMPLGEALNLIEHVKQAGRDLAESQAARRGVTARGGSLRRV